MFGSLDDVASALGSSLASLDVAALGPEDAKRLVQVFSQIERLAVAGRTLAAGRVMDTRAWHDSGYRTPGEWVASRTRGGLKEAIQSLDTARGLSQLPATRALFTSGALSEVQAAEITAAACADQASEQELLEIAERGSVRELRERCRMVIAAAASDEDAAERLRRGRFLKHWTDRDGAVRLDARLTPDDGARVLAAVTAGAERIASDARRSGQREPMHAYMADALVGLTDGEPGPRALVHVQVDNDALQRGRTAPGETCRIDGVGPITVETARRLTGDGIVTAIGSEGADVTRVAHLGRTIPARLRSALEARDRMCVVPECSVRTGLEIDHVVPFTDGGPTTLENLARLCRFHHAGKTHHGWVLGGKPGAWTWTKGPRRRDRVRPPPRAP